MGRSEVDVGSPFAQNGYAPGVAVAPQMCSPQNIHTRITVHTFNKHSSHTCTYINKSKISQTQHILLSMIKKMYNIL